MPVYYQTTTCGSQLRLAKTARFNLRSKPQPTRLRDSHQLLEQQLEPAESHGVSEELKAQRIRRRKEVFQLIFFYTLKYLAS